MNDTRNVFVLILSVMILQIAGAILSMLTPMGLEALGTGPAVIGVIAALYAAGFMFGAWTAPYVLGQIGNIRLFAAAAAVAAAGSILLSFGHHALFWAVIRVIQGVALAYMITSAESWLGATVPAKSRGTVMGVYHVASKAALMVGPFFVAGMSPLDSRSYSWAALFLALAMVPVCVTRQKEPPAPDRDAMSLRELIKIAPAAVFGATLAGMINTGFLALLPIYFEDYALAGGGTTSVAIALAAAWFGGLVLQWPAGMLSDRIERRIVMSAMCALSGLAALTIAIFGNALGEVGAIAMLVIWGGGSLSFYGLCVAHAIDRTETHQISAVMSGILFVWAGGSIVGPLLFGFAMRLHGRVGLFGLAGGLLILLASLMLLRVRQRAAPAEKNPEGWSPILPTPLASVEIDPRAPES